MNLMHNTRIAVVQVLYKIASYPDSSYEVDIKTLADGEKIKPKYFAKCVAGIRDNVDSLDQLIDPLLKNEPASLNVIDRQILRLALYEYQYIEPKLPRKVIINEALDLCHELGTSQGFKLVNSILDTLIA
jgi:transcription antitermination protein NusB